MFTVTIFIKYVSTCKSTMQLRSQGRWLFHFENRGSVTWLILTPEADRITIKVGINLDIKKH